MERWGRGEEDTKQVAGPNDKRTIRRGRRKKHGGPSSGPAGRSARPVTLLALLQTAAESEWQQTMKDDLTVLRARLPKLLKALPDPNEDSVPWLRLAYTFPKLWANL